MYLLVIFHIILCIITTMFIFNIAGDGFFAECPILCRVLFYRALDKEVVCLSAREKALGKQLALDKEAICRVPDTRHTITLGKDKFCRVSGTRQTRTLGKGPPPLPAGSLG